MPQRSFLIDPARLLTALRPSNFCLLTSVLLLLLWGGAVLPGWSAVPPVQLLPFEVSKQEGDKEMVTAPTPGLLLVPHSEQSASDEKYKQRYHLTCYVYIGEMSAASATGLPNSYQRRFAIHAPEAETLPLAKRVARLLLLLYGLNHERLHYDHAFHQTVDVWLSAQKAASSAVDVGGEQFTNQIYLYNILSERRPIEWTREVAHEYGHYALPGVSGFKAPEEWANGVLGERLFLKWMQDDLNAGRIKADDIPFIKPEELEEYLSKQVTPLIRRIERDGIVASQFMRRDTAAMDLYTGLVLYVDGVLGTNALLDALSYTQPKSEGTFIQAPDFLRGVETSLQGANEITYTAPPMGREGRKEGKVDFWVYLPRGEFTAETTGSASSWVFAADTKIVHPIGKNGFLINHSDWRKLTLRFADNSDKPARLHLHRKGADLQ